jgi:hypothetical protein
MTLALPGTRSFGLLPRRRFASGLRASLTAVLLAAGVSACGSDDDSSADASAGLRVLSEGGISEIAFISRPSRLSTGNVFAYTSFKVDPKSANLMRLGTVSGGAQAEPITPFGTGDWPKADITSFDVSFDGQELVFSARLEGDSNYGIYRIKIDGTNPAEPGRVGPELVHMGPYDAVYPVYLPNDRIFFMTNEPPAPGLKQFRDEYERGVTAQAATVGQDGSDLRFGPRNVSHRVFPTLVTLANGQGSILHTNWDHLARLNEGNLNLMNADMTGAAEFFGKEGNGTSNSYMKARQVNETQFLAISTSREKTFQSGAIILIDRGKNEAESSAQVLTPDVPRDKVPSFDKIGRYYDAFPVTDGGGALTHVLASWANGPVHTDIAAGGVNEEGVDFGEGAGPPDFGLYVLDPTSGERLPIFNDPDMWDVHAMAIGKARPTPTISAGITADTPDETALIGSLNVLESSFDSVPDSGIYRVRVIEGFSAEDGVPGDFGMTMADGAILLGEADVEWRTDNSWAAYVPEDRPIHVQIVDEFGMMVVNNDRWFSAAAGEQRFCGGCHEERGSTSTVDPGLSTAFGRGPSNLALPRDQRRTPAPAEQDYAAMAMKLVFPEDPQYADAYRLRGLPWDLAIQPMFDSAGCADCHNGSPGPANPSVTIESALGDGPGDTWTFDLRGDIVDFEQGEMAGAYSRSHISLLLMNELQNQPGITLTTDPNQPYQEYMVPENARDSIIVRYAQPEKVFPAYEPGTLAFAAATKWNGEPYAAQHPNESTPGFDPSRHRPLTLGEKYLLILSADLGGQFYALENAPGQTDADWPGSTPDGN